MNPNSLPTINLSSKALRSGTSSWALTCNVVTKALEEYGCFVALYDDASVELHHKVFQVLKGLFTLPPQTKAENTSPKPYHGYMKPAYPLHLLESFGIEDAEDPEKAMSFTNLMWPSRNQEFRVEKYRAPNKDESNIGSIAHSDKSFLTILHQNNVDGLEIQTKDGQWISYEASAQTFVVMAGEAFLAWSNNRIQAPIHGVVMKGDRIRYSLGIFSFINDIIATPKELIDEQHPLQYKPFDHFGLLRFYGREQNQLSDFTVKDYCGF